MLPSQRWLSRYWRNGLIGVQPPATSRADPGQLLGQVQAAAEILFMADGGRNYQSKIARTRNGRPSSLLAANPLSMSAGRTARPDLAVSSDYYSAKLRLVSSQKKTTRPVMAPPTLLKHKHLLLSVANLYNISYFQGVSQLLNTQNKGS